MNRPSHSSVADMTISSWREPCHEPVWLDDVLSHSAHNLCKMKEKVVGVVVVGGSSAELNTKLDLGPL
jgi:hypothetical protein